MKKVILIAPMKHDIERDPVRQRVCILVPIAIITFIFVCVFVYLMFHCIIFSVDKTKKIGKAQYKGKQLFLMIH